MYPRYIYRSSAYLQGSQPKHTTLARLTIGCQGPKVSGRENEIEGLGGYIAIWLKWRGGGGGKGVWVVCDYACSNVTPCHQDIGIAPKAGPEHRHPCISPVPIMGEGLRTLQSSM